MTSQIRGSTRREFLGAATGILGATILPFPTRSRETHPAEDVLYSNPLASPADVAGFRLEGDATVAFPDGRLRMAANRDPAEGQAANFVYWCPEIFPDRIRISWKFWQVEEPGLCILFFAARGREGEDLFDPRLEARTGEYPQYHSGDIDALHVSYFRRRYAEERAFHTCNLRKSHGFHLVARGADPLPPVADATPPYQIEVVKDGPHVVFLINGLRLFEWTDDGSHGAPLTGGRIGFRQMAPLVAEYSDLVVTSLNR